jgi:ArsR family transcriptional regulator, virulence genes transcriptional regulator
MNIATSQLYGTFVTKTVKVSSKSNGKANGKSVDQQVFERQANICKAFANPVRLHLLDLLGKGDRIVGELQQELGISKANLSQHLTILRSAGVIVTERSGKNVICSLAMPEVRQACTLIRNVLKEQVRRSQRLIG